MSAINVNCLVEGNIKFESFSRFTSGMFSGSLLVDLGKNGTEAMSEKKILYMISVF